MTASRIDRILLGLGALLIIFSSWQLFLKGPESDSGLKLGTLTSALSIVKTKSAVALDWRDASTGIDVSENQLIYTDNASSAEVEFIEGNKLEIGENSLVRLTSRGNEQGMDVSKGFIRARLEGNKALKVQMNGEDYVFTGKDADIQINLQERKGEIGVISGEVKVQAQNLTESLTPDNAIEIDGETITKKKIYFRTVSPEQGAVKYVFNTPTDVVFSWEPQEHATLLISRNRDLKDAEVHIADPSVSVSLEEGLWYYRIESDKGPSLIGSLRIIKETPPAIIRPKEGEEVTVPEDKLLLQWDAQNAKRFVVEWDDGEIHTAETAARSIQITVKPDLPFSWRVKILDENRPEAQWSSWQKVHLTFTPAPNVPEDLVPHDVEFQTYERPQEKIDLQWKGSGKFEVEIKDPDGETHVRKVADTFLTYEATKAGKFFWRVRGVDDYLRSSEWTDWKTFVIEDLSGEISSEGIQRVQLKRPDQAVTFNWEADEGTKSVFELSKDAGFKTIIKRTEVSRDSIQVSVPEIGTYYWRSRLYKADGTFEVGQPKKVIIEPVPAPQKPERLPDIQIELEEAPVKTSLMKKFVDFIIPSAVADDEVKGTVRISLPVKEEAKQYIVRIYHDDDLSELAFEAKLDNKEFEWTNVTPGTYYWQYAIIDYWDRQSLFSDPSLLIVKAEEVPPPVKPRLLYPIRAAEIRPDGVAMRWTHSPNNSKYRVEIAPTMEFRNMISAKETTSNEATFAESNLEAGKYYWRVIAFNKRNKEVQSNIGRFIIKASPERGIIQDFPAPYKKVWNSRGFLAWTPSMDSYTFRDGKTGKIDGNAMMGFLLTGTIFRENYVINGEVQRQTGEVFENEKYLFQRVLIDSIYLLGNSSAHKWGIGVAAGHTSGMAYDIENDKVKSISTAGASYGVVIRNFLSINERWETQGRLQYLAGDITQLDLGGDVIRRLGSYSVIGGVNYSSREYELNSGKQTSLKLTLGFGKEF